MITQVSSAHVGEIAGRIGKAIDCLVKSRWGVQDFVHWQPAECLSALAGDFVIGTYHNHGWMPNPDATLDAAAINSGGVRIPIAEPRIAADRSRLAAAYQEGDAAARRVLAGCRPSAIGKFYMNIFDIKRRYYALVNRKVEYIFS